MGKELIKITKDIIDQEQIDFWIEYIDETLPLAMELPPGNRWALGFGYDDGFKQSNLTLDKINDVKEPVLEYFEALSEIVADLYDNKNKLYVCSFWMAKQTPGGTVSGHDDTDDGKMNPHFKYSAVLYLTDNTNDGQLVFPRLGYQIAAKPGEMAVFPSTGHEYFHEVSEIKHERYSLCFWFTEDPNYAIV